MRISTFLFAIKQGFKNCVRNKLYSFVSIMTTAACLFLFGVFFAILLNVQHIVRNAQEGVCVTVFFTDEATAERKEEIKKQGMLELYFKELISMGLLDESSEKIYPNILNFCSLNKSPLLSLIPSLLLFILL